MAARIPVIEQTTQAGGAGPAFMAAPRVPDGIGQGLSRIGAGLQDVATGQQDLANAQAHAAKVQEHQDAAVWAGNTLSDAQLQWQKTLDEAKNDPKLTANGADGFTPKMVGDFDEWAKGAISKAPNDTSRRYLQTHLASLRTSLGNSALSFEAGARSDYRVNHTLDSFDKASQFVMGNPTKDSFLQTYAQQKAIADTLEVSPEMRRKLNDQLRDKIVTGYWLGRIRQDAQGAMQELQQGMGPSQLEQWKFGTQSSGSSSFDAIVQGILSREGGYNATDGNSGAPVNFGINQRANPDIDVKNLTRDQAKQIYRDRYWNAIGGDSLPPALQSAAMDAAVNQGVSWTNKALAEAGGDVDKFNQLRRQRYQEIAAGDPKQAKFLNNWLARVDSSSTPPARPVVLPDSGIGTDAKPSGNSVVDATPMPLRLQMMQHADSEMNRLQAVWRTQVSTQENDQVAAYMNGQPVAKPLSQQDYVRAYGPLEGLQRFENYKAIAAMGGDVSAMKLATPDQLAATVQRYQPDPAKPGYEAALKRYQLVATAADQVNQARQNDPVMYAQQVKIGDAKPLNFNDPAAFGAQLAQRVGLADTMQSKYGTPYMLLSKAEAATLQQGFQTMTSEQKLGYLQTINKSVRDPKAYRAFMQQVSPDSPVTAMAGIILNKQQPLIVSRMFGSDDTYTQHDVAARLLEGENLLNPSKATKGENGTGKMYPMPKEQDIRDQFNSFVGKAFAGDPQGADFAFQAVKAYYAGQGAKDGDVSGTLDSGRLKNAINAVIGGVADINGKGEVVRPWGMSKTRFKDRVSEVYNTAIERAGLKGSAVDNFGAYGLQTAGDGKYLLRSGTGYLTDRAGNPVVLDVNEAPSAVSLIPTGGPAATLAPPATVKQAPTTKLNTHKPGTK